MKSIKIELELEYIDDKIFTVKATVTDPEDDSILDFEPIIINDDEDRYIVIGEYIVDCFDVATDEMDG